MVQILETTRRVYQWHKDLRVLIVSTELERNAKTKHHDVQFGKRTGHEVELFRVFSSTVQSDHHIHNFHFGFTHVTYERPTGKRAFQMILKSGEKMVLKPCCPQSKIGCTCSPWQRTRFLGKKTFFSLNIIHLWKCMLHNLQTGKRRYHQGVQSWWTWVAAALETLRGFSWNGGNCFHEPRKTTSNMCVQVSGW